MEELYPRRIVIGIDSISALYKNFLRPPRKTIDKPPYRLPRESIRELRIDSLIITGRDSVMRSQVLRETLSPGEKLMTSVYYDFDTVYMDIPGAEEEKLLKQKLGMSPYDERENGNGKTAPSHLTMKSPGQYSDGEIVLENNVVKSNCCRVRRGSETSSSCNIF